MPVHTGTVRVYDTVQRAFLEEPAGTRAMTLQPNCDDEGFQAAHDAFRPKDGQVVSVRGETFDCDGPTLHVTETL